jgi:hypothetical protein
MSRLHSGYHGSVASSTLEAGDCVQMIKLNQVGRSIEDSEKQVHK